MPHVVPISLYQSSDKPSQYFYLVHLEPAPSKTPVAILCSYAARQNLREAINTLLEREQMGFIANGVSPGIRRIIKMPGTKEDLDKQLQDVMSRQYTQQAKVNAQGQYFEKICDQCVKDYDEYIITMLDDKATNFEIQKIEKAQATKPAYTLG